MANPRFKSGSALTLYGLGVLVTSLLSLPAQSGAQDDVSSRCPQPTVFQPIPPHAYFTHPSNCTQFYQCGNGRAVLKQCQPGTVFNDNINVCVHIGSEFDICTRPTAILPTQAPIPSQTNGPTTTTTSPYPQGCDNGFRGLIPHPAFCHQYFNCSSGQMVMEECPYPQLYDVSQQRCVHYSQAACGPGRMAPTWECQYYGAHCWGPLPCRPCAVDFPSCIGRADGVWPNMWKLWSPAFVTCRDQRSVQGEETCPPNLVTGTPQIFHPLRMRCVTLWEIPLQFGGMEPNCAGSRPGYYINHATPLVTYECPGRNLYYCDPPYFVNEDISRCRRIGTAY